MASLARHYHLGGKPYHGPGGQMNLQANLILDSQSGPIYYDP